MAHACFPGPGPNRTCVRAKRPRGHVWRARRQTFSLAMEELVTDLSLDSKEGFFCQVRNSKKTFARLTAGPGVWRRFASMGYMTLCFPAAAEIPRVDVFSRPDQDFAIPTSFTHSFPPFRILFVLSAPFHDVVNVFICPKQLCCAD